MAVVVWNSSSEWNQQLYEDITKVIFGGPATQDNIPEGSIAHIAMARPEGGWQVLDIWESEAAYQTFLQDRIIPAAQEISAPPFDTTVISAHTAITR